MRDIDSPLDGIRSPFGVGLGFGSGSRLYSQYMLNGRLPSLIADFRNNVFATRSLDAYDYALAGQPAALVTSFRDNAYLTSGRETMTAHTRHGLITSGRSTTMIVRDSDGIYKHGAHNLYRNGAGGAQAITVVSGRDYTIRMKGTGSIGYSGAATGTLSGTGADDVVRVEVTATTTTLTVTPSGSTSEIAVYQSDLGGMQLTSDGTDYVENNTGAALYAAPVDYDVNGVRSMPAWEARTNELTHPLDLDNAPSWGAFRTTFSDGAEFMGTGLPWLVCTADATNTNGSMVAAQTVVGKAAGTYTLSVHVKAGPSDPGWLLIRPTDNSDLANNAQVWFDPSTGAVGAVASPGTNFTAASARVVEVNADEYRVEVTFTTNATLSINLRFYLVDGNGSLSVTSGKDIQLQGAQFEAGLGASPFMNGGASTFTRAADNLYTLVSSFGYRQSEGTIVAEFESVGSDGADFPRAVDIDDGTSGDAIRLIADNTSSNTFFAVWAGGASQAGITVAAYTDGDVRKLAAAYKASDFAASADGATAVTASSGSVPAASTHLRYGRDVSANQLNGRLYSLAYYPFRAANSDLEAASA